MHNLVSPRIILNPKAREAFPLSLAGKDWMREERIVDQVICPVESGWCPANFEGG